jgi:hypothetical protein
MSFASTTRSRAGRADANPRNSNPQRDPRLRCHGRRRHGLHCRHPPRFGRRGSLLNLARATSQRFQAHCPGACEMLAATLRRRYICGRGKVLPSRLALPHRPRFRRNFSPLSIWLPRTSPRSVTSLPPTIGPTQWPSSASPRCCTGKNKGSRPYPIRRRLWPAWTGRRLPPFPG